MGSVNLINKKMIVFSANNLNTPTAMLSNNPPMNLAPPNMVAPPMKLTVAAGLGFKNKNAATYLTPHMVAPVAKHTIAAAAARKKSTPLRRRLCTSAAKMGLPEIVHSVVKAVRSLWPKLETMVKVKFGKEVSLQFILKWEWETAIEVLHFLLKEVSPQALAIFIAIVVLLLYIWGRNGGGRKSDDGDE